MRTAAAAVVLLAALTAGSAAAQAERDAGTASAVIEAVPQLPEGSAANASQPKRNPGAAAKTAPDHKPPPRRRSVQQIIARVPPPPLAGPSYGPTLYPAPTPSVPAPAPVYAPGVPPVSPPPPAALSQCRGSVCIDAAGNTYNAGVGNAAVDSQGRLCSRVGATVQCF